jgi:hypothetical protein
MWTRQMRYLRRAGVIRVPGEGHAADHALREDDDAVYPGLFDAVLAGQRQMARPARMPG